MFTQREDYSETERRAAIATLEAMLTRQADNQRRLEGLRRTK